MVKEDIKGLVAEATEFVENYHKENGTKGYIAERIRDGFIGNVVYTDEGIPFIQTTRGKPYGTIVSIPNGDDISIGVSYLDEEDKNFDYPIIGLYLALKRAIDRKEKGETRLPKHIKSKSRKQLEHFEKRSLAFFHPDVYSYSRGIEGKKVVYEDYDIIHERRAKILGEVK